MFEPHTREKAIGLLPLQNTKPCLLIVNGHGSYIRADFIAYCIKNSINLLVIPFYCLYLLQPLNIKVFTIFKRVYNGETNAVFKFNIQIIFCFKWLQMFQRVRFKTIIFTNIRAE